MNEVNWESINDKLNIMYEDIFKEENVDTLDSYTKRKIIFNYLCNNIKYDYDLLERIKLKIIDPESTLSRNANKEVNDVLDSHKGICNAIAQVYKLLLEKAGIYSICVICDDGTDVKHQLNLVYNEQIEAYSFDDVTSVMVNRGSTDEYFDYDSADAMSYNQGWRPAYNNNVWVILPTQYVYAIVGRKEEPKIGLDEKNLFGLPHNVVSYKKINNGPNLK